MPLVTISRLDSPGPRARCCEACGRRGDPEGCSPSCPPCAGASNPARCDTGSLGPREEASSSSPQNTSSSTSHGLERNKGYMNFNRFLRCTYIFLYFFISELPYNTQKVFERLLLIIDNIYYNGNFWKLIGILVIKDKQKDDYNSVYG